MEQTPASVQLPEAVDEPAVIFGPPHALRGTLNLHNAGEGRVRVRALGVAAPALKGPAGLPLTRARVLARLEPGQRRSVQVMLEVDPTTPPGTYEAEVVVGDARHPLRVVVCESLRARIEPQQLTFFTEGELRFETTYVAENQGNVPFPTGVLCTAPLLDGERGAGATGRPPAPATAERTADQALRELLAAYAPVSAGPIRIRRDGGVVRPGEARVGKAVVELPPGLRPHHHYFALLELYGVQGWIDVYTGKMPHTEADAG